MRWWLRYVRLIDGGSSQIEEPSSGKVLVSPTANGA